MKVRPKEAEGTTDPVEAEEEEQMSGELPR